MIWKYFATSTSTGFLISRPEVLGDGLPVRLLVRARFALLRPRRGLPDERLGDSGWSLGQGEEGIVFREISLTHWWSFLGR